MPELPPLPPIATTPLSVVLLAHNNAAHLETVVADWVTFLNGLDRDYELLLVDDGSTDRTAELATALSEKFQRVRVLRHPAHKGEGASLRTAFAVARHPLVAYAPCDPLYQPADLKRLLQAMDPVHLISGYRAGRPVPRAWRMAGALLRGFSRWVLSHPLTPLPGWLGWKGHAGQWLVRVLFGVRNRDVLCPFRLLRKEILARIPLQSDGPFAHVEILAKSNFLGHILGEEIPLGDRNRPVPAEPRGTIGQYFREGYRVFSHPDFGPVTVAAPGSKGPAQTAKSG
jgi:glycosyltransferase involved in cell wall biosynthesis